MHAGLLEDDPRGATGDHAGSGRSRLHQHAATAGASEDRVDDRAPGHRHLEQIALGFLGALLDRQWHLLGLAVSEADAAVAVADHHESGEREPAATLDHLRDAVDRDDTRLAQATVIAVAVVAAATVAGIIAAVGHQNSKPASRAADATAATRPW